MRYEQTPSWAACEVARADWEAIKDDPGVSYIAKDAAHGAALELMDQVIAESMGMLPPP